MLNLLWSVPLFLSGILVVCAAFTISEKLFMRYHNFSSLMVLLLGFMLGVIMIGGGIAGSLVATGVAH